MPSPKLKRERETRTRKVVLPQGIDFASARCVEAQQEPGEIINTHMLVIKNLIKKENTKEFLGEVTGEKSHIITINSYRSKREAHIIFNSIEARNNAYGRFKDDGYETEIV